MQNPMFLIVVQVRFTFTPAGRNWPDRGREKWPGPQYRAQVYTQILKDLDDAETKLGATQANGAFGSLKIQPLP